MRGTALGPLTHRERLLRTLRHQAVDRVPDFEFELWAQTRERWQREGMRVEVPLPLERTLERYFGTDDAEYGPGLGINVVAEPRFEETILEERGRYQLIQDDNGALCERLMPEPGEFGGSMPRFLRFAVESRADWQRLRDERLDPCSLGRVPPQLGALARRLRGTDYPITVFLGGLYGYIRNWLGVERLSLLIYDDLPFVEEMMEHLTRLTLSVLEKLAGKGFRIDQGDWWEDMCFNHGSLLSPRLFNELMVPRYRRVTEFMRREFGTEFHRMDCDGNIHELVPLWLDAGINVMFPLEVAHTDANRILDRFGQRVAIQGGFDKRALIAGPAAIDAELDRLQPLLEQRGCIPHTDHLVPPDVSYANYLYYRHRKCELIGKPWREPGVRFRPGHVTAWRVLGLLAPEAERALPSAMEEASGWCRYEGPAGVAYVDLACQLGSAPLEAALAACTLSLPGEGEGWLELGSDGRLQVWLNGEAVWDSHASRIANQGQDLLPVRLRQGRNDLLLRVGAAQGRRGFYLRPADDHGNPWPGLVVER